MLTKRHEKILDRWAKTNEGMRYLSGYDISYDSLPASLVAKLERVKDTETLWMDTERYLGDLALEARSTRWGSSKVAGSTARALIQAITFDMQPRASAAVDFGIDSQKHYEALYYPIRRGEITLRDLEKVVGDGPAITELVRRKGKSNPHRNIKFTTSYDRMGSTMDREKLAGELVRIAKRLTAARVGDAKWDDMLALLAGGRKGRWQFDGRGGLRVLESWLKSQGARPYRGDSYSTVGDQINYKLNGMKIQAIESNFMGAFIDIEAGSITPYLGD
jgi:hypothetical protein